MLRCGFRFHVAPAEDPEVPAQDLGLELVVQRERLPRQLNPNQPETSHSAPNPVDNTHAVGSQLCRVQAELLQSCLQTRRAPDSSSMLLLHAAGHATANLTKKAMRTNI
jgi:hypothetical protein